MICNEHIDISVVIPAYNESENLHELYLRLCTAVKSYCEECSLTYEFLFIDDGSTDDTLSQLELLRQTNVKVRYLSFSRNFGHQHALKAGLDFSRGECVISMDADLQHPPDMIPKMIEYWKQGYDIVYTQRKDDPNLSRFKRVSSSYFYGILNRLSEINLEKGTADFRLLDRAVVDIIKENQEYHFFLRGYISWLGFKQFKIVYSPSERFAGKTKYTFKKMLNLALTGITSFSTKPLHFATLFGFSISVLAFLYAFYAIVIAVFTDSTVSGWASVLVSVLFIGGIQLLMLGIIGEYLGKLFMQAKKRPFYIIRKKSF